MEVPSFVGAGDTFVDVIEDEEIGEVGARVVIENEDLRGMMISELVVAVDDLIGEGLELVTASDELEGVGSFFDGLMPKPAGRLAPRVCNDEMMR